MQLRPSCDLRLPVASAARRAPRTRWPWPAILLGLLACSGVDGPGVGEASGTSPDAGGDVGDEVSGTSPDGTSQDASAEVSGTSQDASGDLSTGDMAGTSPSGDADSADADGDAGESSGTSDDASQGLDIDDEITGDADAADAENADADDADAPPCVSALTSIADFPLTSAKVDFETCSDCLCCLPGGLYPAEIPIDCLACGPVGALQKVGAALAGGQLTTMVSCVTGNADAPMENLATFVGTSYATPAGKAALQLTLHPEATMFGFSAVPTSSEAKPIVVLRGYDDAGALVAHDAFDFAQAPGGSCATLNPAVQFFGFRPCFGAKLRKVIVEVSDANVAVDEVRVFRP